VRVPREDLRVPDAEADLYLVGLGIGGLDSRSVEVDAILRQASVVLHLTAFDDSLRAMSSGLVVDLRLLYESDDDPKIVYDSITHAVLCQATDQSPGRYVAFASYGHPLNLVDSNWDILSQARSHGLRAKAIAATSFVDQVLVDLEHRFDRGLQAYEANFFMERRVEVDPRIALLLSQVGHFHTKKLRTHTNIVSRMHPLMSRLGELYPSERRCCVIFSSWRSDMAPEVAWTTIGEIAAIVSSIHTGCSLFVAGDSDVH
jgi:hypothetical protein